MSVRPAPSTLAVAAGLALAAAVSLGLARFAYALLLPPMRADLGWSYFTAGAMNTVNAAGYLVGALLMPRALARFDARDVLLVGSAGSGMLLGAHGLVASDAALFVLRLFTGAASAAAFVAGGLLAARLAATAEVGAATKSAATADGTAAAEGAAVAKGVAATSGLRPRGRIGAGLVLGIYYGGTGVGIIASALMVPPMVARATSHAWQGAWIALGLAALAATALTWRITRHLAVTRAAATPHLPFGWAPFGFGLAGYLMFGLGYIGYMTFVIGLLREQRISAAGSVAFFIVLGAGVIVSSWLWAGMLQRFRGGESLAILNGLLAVATVLPVLSAHPVAVFASGLLFGCVFLSIVASTTALVRHNLPAAAWPGGIGAFTIVFAAGQIVGPSLVGLVADGPGGLARGFVVSALVLAGGALLAALQRPLGSAR